MAKAKTTTSTTEPEPDKKGKKAETIRQLRKDHPHATHAELQSMAAKMGVEMSLQTVGNALKPKAVKLGWAEMFQAMNEIKAFFDEAGIDVIDRWNELNGKYGANNVQAAVIEIKKLPPAAK